MNKINIYCVLFLSIRVLSCFAQSQHPRLLFNQEDIPNIWNKINRHSSLRNYYEDLRDDAYDNRLFPFYNNRHTMHFASDKAFVYFVDTAYPYRNEFKDYSINSITRMYNRALICIKKVKSQVRLTDDLTFSAALLHISLVYDLIYSELTFSERYQAASQIKTLLDTLETLGKIQVSYGNNHSMHLGAAIGIAAITIKGDLLDSATVFTEDELTPYINTVNEWMKIVEKGMFASDGSSLEGAKYAVFGATPIVAYYEVLRRYNSTDLFKNSNFKKLHEWLINELLPAEARHPSISESLFDFNPINSSFNWKNNFGDHYGTASTMISVLAVLGGIYQNEPTAGAATWLFEHHLDILLNYDEFEKAPANYFGTSNILVFIKYANNARHPDSIKEFPRTKFFLGRGLIVRDGYSPDGTLFSFETNYNCNPETGKPHCRWDEDDNNSFTFFAYGRRWVIDCAQKSEESRFHNTVLIDRYDQPYRDQVNQQVTNWYDYHNSNDIYYIISDITDAWKKKVHLWIPSWCDGIGKEVYYVDYMGKGKYPEWSTRFSSLKRYRRHAQFIQKENGLPPYIIIYDDINVDDSYHDYTFLLHTGPGNTVGGFDRNLNKVRITSSNCMMDVYMNSVDETIDFSTDNVDGNSYFVDTHYRLKFTSNAVNPRFHAVLVPSGNYESKVTGLSYNNLEGQGSLATIKFSSDNQKVTDQSLFSYQKSLNYQGFALEGYSLTDTDAVPGIMGYCRRDEVANQFTDIFLSRGSYLKMGGKELVSISGRTARVILKDRKIDIYKVYPADGRYSYKIYGKGVSHFKINEGAYSFEAFNDYNYVKSAGLILNYYLTVLDSNRVKVSWSCPEKHDIKMYYWNVHTLNKVYTRIESGRNSGYNFLYITLDRPIDWRFKLEGTMHKDKFIDLTETFKY
jgi:hypothetical protein